MGQKKQLRFSEIKQFENVLEHSTHVKGKWNAFFGNNNPVTLELACGKGEYTVGLASIYPSQNFIGVDIKGNRIWRGAKTALENNLANAAFLRAQIDHISEYFSENEVSEIWLTFPDPQLRFSKMKKRLTHPKFLRLYKKILQPGGIVHLKTDSPRLFFFTKTVVQFFQLTLLFETSDLYALHSPEPALNIKTHYEMLDIAQSNKIFYLRFLLDNDLPVEKDLLLKNIFHEQTDV